MSVDQSNTSSDPVDPTQGVETAIREVDWQSENSTNTEEVVLTEQEKKDKEVHQLVESYLGKPYTKPSDEKRRAFERFNGIACLHDSRHHRASRLLAALLVGEKTVIENSDIFFFISSVRSWKTPSPEIQEEETRLGVTWILDDACPDGGFYKDDVTEYKDFDGDPCAGGSGGVPCFANPDVWKYTCGEVCFPIE